MLRHIDGVFGDPWNWRLDVIKPHYFSQTALLVGGEGLIARFSAYRQIIKTLKLMGFTRAKALRRGRWKYYKVG